MTPELYPLSPMQQGMLFHSLYAPQTGVYVQQLICTFNEPLSISAFERAWKHIVQRHAILRTSFHWEGSSGPLQQVHRDVRLPWQYEDWRGLPAGVQTERFETYLQTDQLRGFDINVAPLLRLKLLRFGNAEYRFIWTSHHALLDGRSRLVVLKELSASYDAFRQSRNPQLAAACPYSDYILWLDRQELADAERFWSRHLAGFTAATPLVVDRLDHEAASGHDSYGSEGIRLSSTFTADLQSFAKEHQVTINTILQGAWALLLNRYSGTNDVVFGATMACRLPFAKENTPLVGLFINTLPVRADTSAEKFVVPFLRELRSQWLAVRDYEHTPLRKVQGWSDVPPGKPLFESVLIFETYSLNSVLRAQQGIWNGREFRVRGRTNYPITVTGHLDPELVLEIGYDETRFDRATIRRLLGHIQTLIHGMVANPQRSISELPMLTQQERRTLVVEWNQTSAEFPKDECIHQLFEAQAKRSPDAVAVKFESNQLTYEELNRRTNQLAHHLQKLGVGPEILVGISMERSLHMVIGLLGILKAGGAYVPLDPAYPADRLEFMLQESRARIVLTQQHLAKLIPPCDVQLICLDTTWNNIALEASDNVNSGVTADNLAYVIFTSGSTGQPKGVMVCHRGICNFLNWRRTYFPLTETDRLLQKTSISFDDSVWEFFEPLMTGAQLVIARPGGHQDTAYLAQMISEHKITAVSFVSSMLRAFLEDPAAAACTTLRRVTTGGEAVTVELQDRFFARSPANLYNGYGPTEASISATFWTCRREPNQRSVPIGRPIANTAIYILDDLLRPVPIGVPGELYIGGAGLARGYLNQPALTAERFIADPFSAEPGARLYRTGDLTRYRPDGDIEFLGRVDNQVKIRGFRIELEEIEAALRRHPAVRDAVVQARDHASGNKRIVAYIIPHAKQPISKSGIQVFLKTTLPDYMIPSVVVTMTALPLTPTGKLNRSALPVPDEEDFLHSGSFVAPRTPVEEAVANIWVEVLHAQRVGINDNFFELGGDSLSATQVVSRLRHAFDVEISILDMFQRPTIAEFAARITQMRG